MDDEEDDSFMQMAANLKEITEIPEITSESELNRRVEIAADPEAEIGMGQLNSSGYLDLDSPEIPKDPAAIDSGSQDPRVDFVSSARIPNFAPPHNPPLDYADSENPQLNSFGHRNAAQFNLSGQLNFPEEQNPALPQLNFTAPQNPAPINFAASQNPPLPNFGQVENLFLGLLPDPPNPNPSLVNGYLLNDQNPNPNFQLNFPPPSLNNNPTFPVSFENPNFFFPDQLPNPNFFFPDQLPNPNFFFPPDQLPNPNFFFSDQLPNPNFFFSDQLPNPNFNHNSHLSLNHQYNFQQPQNNVIFYQPQYNYFPPPGAPPVYHLQHNYVGVGSEVGDNNVSSESSVVGGVHQVQDNSNNSVGVPSEIGSNNLSSESSIVGGGVDNVDAVVAGGLDAVVAGGVDAFGDVDVDLDPVPPLVDLEPGVNAYLVDEENDGVHNDGEHVVALELEINPPNQVREGVVNEVDEVEHEIFLEAGGPVSVVGGSQHIGDEERAVVSQHIGGSQHIGDEERAVVSQHIGDEGREDVALEHPEGADLFRWVKDASKGTPYCFEELIEKGITSIEGQMRCHKCGGTFNLAYALKDSLQGLSAIFSLHQKDQAYNEWETPSLLDCTLCNAEKQAFPVIADKEGRINWLFLFCSNQIGSCEKDQINGFCYDQGLDTEVLLNIEVTLFKVYKKLYDLLDPKFDV